MPQKIIRFAHWNINRTCNYSCSYCVSGNRKKNFKKDPSPYLFLNEISKCLKGQWRFQLCGSGEPFLAPKFLEITKELIKMGHQVGIITNLSSPLKNILEFCDITKGNLFEFDVSLHLEHVKPKEFLKKAVIVKEFTGDVFSVKSVARKGHVAELRKISQIFWEQGILFSMQLERKHGIAHDKKEESFVNYSKEELDIIKKTGKTVFDKNKLKLKGKLCWAGVRYMAINEDGEVWRCLPARRYKFPKESYLGNLAKGTFKLKEKPYPCPYKYCYCLAAWANNIIIKGD